MRELFTMPAPLRPTVLIQSDDWGRVGTASGEAIDALRSEGWPIGDSPWDRYGLETPDDLEALAHVLRGAKDSDGSSACMTANFVMGNADLRRMRKADYREFHWIPIAQGFPLPWTDNLLPVYRELRNEGLFYPALHGLTHFNVDGLMAALADAGDLGRRARALADNDIPYLGSLTPEYNFALVARGAGTERFLPADRQEDWIARGVASFEEAFGEKPLSACAPGYRANATTHRLWQDHGVRVVQLGGGRSFRTKGKLLNLARNVFFEPVLDAGDPVDAALAQAERAVQAGFPIVICSHSISYLSRFVGRRDAALAQLERLLGKLLEGFPNLRFANDAMIERALRSDDGTWFRSPSPAQVVARTARAFG